MLTWEERIDIVKDSCEVKSNRQLEEVLGLANGYINDLLKGKNKNPAKLAGALIKVFKVNPIWFYDETVGIFGDNADRNQEKNIEIAPTGHQIPVLRQKVSCGPGQNWDNEVNIERYLNVFDILPRLRTGKIYAFPVIGSSMLGVGIRDGDIVLFDTSKSQDMQDGNYVFSLDGDVYCKRLEFDALSRIIKVYSVRVADLEKAELAMSFKADDPSTADRLTIFGRVHAWIHPEDERK